MRVCWTHDFLDSHLIHVSLSFSSSIVCKLTLDSEMNAVPTHLRLLVDPIEVGHLPGHNLVLAEPQSDLFLGTLDTVGTVADVSTDVNGVVTSDGTWVGSERVGSTKDSSASLAGIATFPDHGDDGTAQHVWSLLAWS